MKKGIWEIFKDFWCEDNGNGSATRLVYILGNVALFGLLFYILYHKFHQVPVPDLDLTSLAIFAGAIEGVLTAGKVIQKTKEEGTEGEQKTSTTDTTTTTTKTTDKSNAPQA